MSVKAFMDGAYVVDLETGSSTRLGDVLTHQKGGSNFCDGRVVILDCDTDGEWEGRLDVYGRGDDGQWRREHSVGGFWKARDEIISLAGDRLLAIKGSQGLFFCAVRGDQLRYLGQLPIPYAEAFDDQQGRTIVRVHNRYSYHLTNLDEVLDAAFARGESPTSFDLPESAWK